MRLYRVMYEEDCSYVIAESDGLVREHCHTENALGFKFVPRDLEHYDILWDNAEIQLEYDILCRHFF